GSPLRTTQGLAASSGVPSAHQTGRVGLLRNEVESILSDRLDHLAHGLPAGEDLGRRAQFLADDAAHDVFELGRTLLAVHELAEHRVHRGLVVAAAGSLHLAAEVVHDVAVDPDGDALLARRGQHRAALSMAEIIMILHWPSYSLRSREFARRAEIKRISPPRHVYTTTSVAGQGIQAQDDKAFFRGIGFPIGDGHGERILQHRHCVGEVNAVLFDIGFQLPGIPVDRHYSVYVYMYNEDKLQISPCWIAGAARGAPGTR